MKLKLNRKLRKLLKHLNKKKGIAILPIRKGMPKLDYHVKEKLKLTDICARYGQKDDSIYYFHKVYI